MKSIIWILVIGVIFALVSCEEKREVKVYSGFVPENENISILYIAEDGKDRAFETIGVTLVGGRVVTAEVLSKKQLIGRTSDLDGKGVIPDLKKIDLKVTYYVKQNCYTIE